MDNVNITVLGDFVDPELVDFEGSLSFTFRAGYLEKGKLWKSKDISAEFIGDFWKNILEIEEVKPTLHFVCAELLENAVYHSKNSDYLIRIGLFFKTDELMVYVRNSVETEKTEAFKTFVRLLLEAENLQKVFIERMKAAKKSGSKKSQIGLITMLKDRGVKLSWKLEEGPELTNITTLAKIRVARKDA